MADGNPEVNARKKSKGKKKKKAKQQRSMTSRDLELQKLNEPNLENAVNDDNKISNAIV